MIAGSILFGLMAMFGYGLANVYSLPIARRFGSARFLLIRGLAICAILAVTAIPTLGSLRDWRAALAALAIGVLGYLPPLAFTHGIKMSRISIVAPNSRHGTVHHRTACGAVCRCAAAKQPVAGDLADCSRQHSYFGELS